MQGVHELLQKRQAYRMARRGQKLDAKHENGRNEAGASKASKKTGCRALGGWKLFSVLMYHRFSSTLSLQF